MQYCTPTRMYFRALDWRHMKPIVARNFVQIDSACMDGDVTVPVLRSVRHVSMSLIASRFKHRLCGWFSFPGYNLAFSCFGDSDLARDE